jgi:hypothetical protein
LLNRKKEKIIQKIKTQLLEGIELREKSEPLTFNDLDKLVENFATELSKVQAISNQAMYG